jgi:hypothetical protein
MRPDPVVIGSVIVQNATQLRFVEHHEVIEAFAPNRADEALDVSVVPWRAWCGFLIRIARMRWV